MKDNLSTWPCLSCNHFSDGKCGLWGACQRPLEWFKSFKAGIEAQAFLKVWVNANDSDLINAIRGREAPLEKGGS